MTTIVFVHGTGVREFDTSEYFKRARDELLRREPSGLSVVPCAWGDVLGYRPLVEGLSIPEYSSTLDASVLGPAGPVEDDTVPPPEEVQPAVWGLLYEDPIAELRLLAAEAEEPETLPAAGSAGAVLLSRFQGLSVATVPAPLRAGLRAGGIEGTFDAAVQAVGGSGIFQDALWAMPEEAQEEYTTAAARAAIAGAMAESQRLGTYPSLFLDADLRDDIVGQVARELGAVESAEPTTLGLLDPVRKAGRSVMARLLTRRLRRRRGAATGRVIGFCGDILLYQSRGSAIREFIRQQVEDAEPPVVLLGHSLGGIACVDMLVEHNQRDRVPLLITVGSQAPVLYEIGALPSLPYDAAGQLPDHFPPWLNIYDLQDFLSYVGEPLFRTRIKDVQVDSRQPFPHAHGAYFANPVAMDIMAQAIRAPDKLLADG